MTVAGSLDGLIRQTGELPGRVLGGAAASLRPASSCRGVLHRVKCLPIQPLQLRITEKDKTFLENLKQLMESKDLWVELKPGRPSYLVLKGTYGEKIHKTFRITRQGVRWRFQRLFSQVYVEAFETILMIEKTFGMQLRDYGIRISRDRHETRRESQTNAAQRR